MHLKGAQAVKVVHSESLAASSSKSHLYSVAVNFGVCSLMSDTLMTISAFLSDSNWPVSTSLTTTLYDWIVS